MADFKNKYPGYRADLQKLNRGLGTAERIRQFRQYMRDKAANSSNARKKEAANTLVSLFTKVIDLQTKLTKFTDMFPRLEAVLAKDKDELTEEDSGLLESAGEMEERLFDQMDELEDISDAMSEYNEADGYSELKSTELLQEMYRMKHLYNN